MDEREQLLRRVRRMVDEQALDDGLWFRARTAPEAYLQQELRALHQAIEDAIPPLEPSRG